jgi:hypothetical protein
VLRRTFGPKREDVEGDWRRQHNQVLHNAYALSDIISMIKSFRVRWAGYVTRMEEKRNTQKIFVGKREG